MIDAAANFTYAGRPRDALKLLQLVHTDRLSWVFSLFYARVKACAAADAKDQAAIDDALAILRRGKAFEANYLIEALICTGDIKEAGAETAALLADPKTRLDALSELQIYANTIGPPGPRDALMTARKAELRNRPEVVQAVQAVGRIGRWDFIDVNRD